MSQRIHRALYRIGISSDFRHAAPGRLEPALVEFFDGEPSIRYHYFPATGFDDAGPYVRPEDIAGLDAVICLGHRFTAWSFDADTSLALIARWGVGYDKIDVPACTAHNVALAITVDAVRRPVAEAILTLVLVLAKQVPAKDAGVRQGRWDRAAHMGLGLRGKVFGSIGYGNIAAEFFRLIEPFGAAGKLAADPYAAPETAAQQGVELVDLETVMEQSDFLTVNCPLNPETHGLVDADRLALMKPTAFLINTARGPIVNQRDLTLALQRRRIAGAGLDVFEQEPIAADDPLLALDNVILSPHSLAWTDELYRDNSRHACRNVLAMLQGEVPLHVVNRAVCGQPDFQAKLAALLARSGRDARTDGMA